MMISGPNLPSTHPSLESKHIGTWKNSASKKKKRVQNF